MSDHEKSNSSAFVAQVKANLQVEFSVQLHFRQRKCCKKTPVTLKCLPHIFALAVTVSVTYKFQTCDLQKVRQGQGMQFSQLHHSMPIVKMYIMSPTHFGASSYRFIYKKMLICYIQKVVQDYGV